MNKSTSWDPSRPYGPGLERLVHSILASAKSVNHFRAWYTVQHSRGIKINLNRKSAQLPCPPKGL